MTTYATEATSTELFDASLDASSASYAAWSGAVDADIAQQHAAYAGDTEAYDAWGEVEAAYTEASTTSAADAYTYDAASDAAYGAESYDYSSGYSSSYSAGADYSSSSYSTDGFDGTYASDVDTSYYTSYDY